jgi:hypothetical protein
MFTARPQGPGVTLILLSDSITDTLLRSTRPIKFVRTAQAVHLASPAARSLLYSSSPIRSSVTCLLICRHALHPVTTRSMVIRFLGFSGSFNDPGSRFIPAASLRPFGDDSLRATPIPCPRALVLKLFVESTEAKMGQSQRFQPFLCSSSSLSENLPHDRLSSRGGANDTG